MYVYTKSLVKEKGTNKRWLDVDLRNLTLSNIYSTYTQVYLFLNNTTMQSDVVVDLMHYRSELRNSTATLNNYLVSLGNTALVTTDDYPVLKGGTLKYADAFHAGYKVDKSARLASTSVELPEEDLTDIYMTRGELVTSVFEENVLVSINGFIHYSDADAGGVLVHDANTSRHISTNNHIGLYSFYELGGIKKVKITNDMILQHGNAELHNSLVIKLAEDISHYTPAIVIGGFLHILDRDFLTVLANDQLLVNIGKLDLIDRYYRSLENIDVSSLPVTKYDRNDKLVEISEIHSEEYIRAYLTLSQSFIVLIKNKEVYREDVHLSLLPQKTGARTKLEPVFPVRDGGGLLVDYWYHHEDGEYYLSYLSRNTNNYLDSTTSIEYLDGYVDSRYSTSKSHRDHIYFMKISTDL